MSDPLAPVIAALAQPGRPSSDYELNPDVALPPGRVLRPAAVLVAFEQHGDGLRLYLTKRASHLKHHPGQIAFPGGKVDPGDRGVVAAALREAHEEIGLPPDHVKVLGTLDTHETVTQFQVTPVIAQITTPFIPRSEPGEVEQVFTIPFGHVVDPAAFRIESRLWRGTRRKYYVVPYGPYYIWGATAGILRQLAQRMADETQRRMDHI
ncbi:coenzyme A pyrophosphatase [Thioclava sp. SK-1]|uniref:CoA pyrophosphatase n=1 Tax=Thioclava sp. SK-1 TaxID=1889770 RepID=UPI000824C898|nr:CoA pyrophosphatase [Thioclava sp. SK-1]OCX61671.1 coenzyme A pyrophosphatase [Thioclava sp. SK-1]